MNGPEYELGRRRLLRVTGAGILGTASLSAGVGAAAESVEGAPDEDEYGEILEAMAGDGSGEDPYVVTDVVELQAMAGDVTGTYELGNDIDASATADWNDGRGFDPIFDENAGDPDDADIEDPDGDVDDEGIDDPDDAEPPADPGTGEFAGILLGNEHEITGLTIDRPDEVGVGLFLANLGTLFGFTVRDASMNGAAGGVLVASNGGNVGQIAVEGELTGEDTVGGIAGANGGQVVECDAAVDVTGRDAIGGTVGLNVERLFDVTATGAVTGRNAAGGLVGRNNGNVDRSRAEGAATGEIHVGGLVGGNTGRLTGSVATGPVTGDREVGGAVGENFEEVLGVTTEGDVDGGERVGGLVGESYGEVRVCAALGDVTGGERVGGLVGWNAISGIIADSYAFGALKGNVAVGALVGLFGDEFMREDETVELRRCYWNADETDADPVGVEEPGDGEVTFEEGTVAGLSSEQFVGENVTEHLAEFDFDQHWRTFADDVPQPRAQTPAVFEIVDVSSTELRVTQDDLFELTVGVENTAEWDGTQPVGLFIQGDPLEVTELTLEPGESAEVSFDELEAAVLPTGNHVFTVETLDDVVQGTLTVETGTGDDSDDAGPDPGDDADGADPDDVDDDGPGFGVPAAVTGVGTAAYLLSRRFDREKREA